MTGVYNSVSESKLERLRKLTQEGLGTRIIAERLGMTIQQVYYYQTSLGLRKKKERKAEPSVNKKGRRNHITMRQSWRKGSNT